eukprot:4813182-Amphidinium_carterae.1
MCGCRVELGFYQTALSLEGPSVTHCAARTCRILGRACDAGRAPLRQCLRPSPITTCDLHNAGMLQKGCCWKVLSGCDANSYSTVYFGTPGVVEWLAVMCCGGQRCVAH